MRTDYNPLERKTLLIKRLTAFKVPGAGIEPAHLTILEFESSASTNSANRAVNWFANIELFLILVKLFSGNLTYYRRNFEHTN